MVFEDAKNVLKLSQQTNLWHIQDHKQDNINFFLVWYRSFVDSHIKSLH